jgi:hypothetical protein
MALRGDRMVGVWIVLAYQEKENSMAQYNSWTGRTLGEPTPEQWEALKAFAAEHGRTWKAQLRDAWMTGQYPCVTRQADQDGLLQQVRNTFGPRWLNLIDIEAPR